MVSTGEDHERSYGFKVMRKSEVTQLKKQETDKVDTPTGLSQDAVAEISGGLRQLMADVFVLYLYASIISISHGTYVLFMCFASSTVMSPRRV